MSLHKLIAPSLVTHILLPYIIPYLTALRSSDYSSYFPCNLARRWLSLAAIAPSQCPAYLAAVSMAYRNAMPQRFAGFRALGSQCSDSADILSYVPLPGLYILRTPSKKWTKSQKRRVPQCPGTPQTSGAGISWSFLHRCGFLIEQSQLPSHQPAGVLKAEERSAYSIELATHKQPFVDTQEVPRALGGSKN